jgi:predicted AlkP superfamily phosphohydrolase/phosphomutase
MSLDGARDDWVDGYLADGTMPNLAALAKRGVRAEWAQTIDPSLTAAAHVSIACGAYPSATGQVSNKFHLSKNSFYWYTSGFDEPEMQVEPLWRTAMRHGHTTAKLFWPGTSLLHEDRLADYTVAYGKREVYSRLHAVAPQPAEGWKSAPTSYSPQLEAVLPILGRDDARVTTVYVLLVDASDNGAVDYDTFWLCPAREANDRCAQLQPGGWAPLLVRPRLHGGGHFKLIRGSSDSVEVFQSALWYNEARPAELLRDINERFGFFPPTPDYYALEHGWIKPEDYWRMAELQTRWLAEVEAYVLESYEPDLTFAWLGATDECGHQFLMVDERQAGYTDAEAKQFQGYIRQAYALADEALGRVAAALDSERDAIFVVSDHGMAPIHSQVYVNTILEQAGLLRYGEGASYPIDTSESRAVSFTSGGAVNVYINLKGREQPGIVLPEDYTGVQDEIVEALQSAKGLDGELVFARVLRREELDTLHLDAPQSGDVFAQAQLGYALTDWRGNPSVAEPATYYGQHGYDSTLPEMRAIWVAAGGGLRAAVSLPPMHVIDLAPTVAALLGFPPPDTMAGRVVHAALR